MAQESATPDLVESAQQAFEAASRHDLDAVMGFHAPDAVLDMSAFGFETYEGAVAIREFTRGWWATFEDLTFNVETVVDLGNGVVYGVYHQEGRLPGSTGVVGGAAAVISEWEDGMIAHLIYRYDTDEARADAERFAEERG
jgi:ketosteroid isomerase-like protein